MDELTPDDGYQEHYELILSLMDKVNEIVEWINRQERDHANRYTV